MSRFLAKVLLCTATFILFFYSVTLLISACCSLESALLNF